MTIYYIADLVGAACKRDRLILGYPFARGVGPHIFYYFLSKFPPIANAICMLNVCCMLIFSMYQCSFPLTWPWQDQHGATKSSCAPCELQGVGNVDCPVAGGQGGNMCRSMSAEDGWLVWASGRKIEQRLAVKLRFTTHTVQLRIRSYPCW